KSAMKLIVGLGNPGQQYAGTRHNVGFEVVEALGRRLGWIGSSQDFASVAKRKFEGLFLEGMAPLASGPEKLLLLEPLTFMNRSGQSVQSAMAFFQLQPPDVLIVLDDTALPVGRLRLRSGGSSGGHNGLRSIEEAIGTQQYPRLRIGVDAAPELIPQRDYVLGRFSPEQRKRIDPAIRRAGDAIIAWVEKGIDAAMSLFNAAEDKM
ncbi:MAG: aminoacyl-tRNA hydrolase, partial [Phycisphaerae bacterium]|nr:aminoacyl-tRNA hydrolase [Phycisphaerae bacterium]